MQRFELLGWLVQLTVFTNCDPLFTERTITEVEEDTRREPFDLEPFLEALHMEYMATLAHDAGSRR